MLVRISLSHNCFTYGLESENFSEKIGTYFLYKYGRFIFFSIFNSRYRIFVTAHLFVFGKLKILIWERSPSFTKNKFIVSNVPVCSVSDPDP
jgi:hypothetical protein